MVMEWCSLWLYLPWLARMMSQNLRHSFCKVWFSPIIPVIRIQVNDLHSVKNNILKEITDLPAISPHLGSFCNMEVYQNCISFNTKLLNIYHVPSTVLRESKWVRHGSCPRITYSVVVEQQVTQNCFRSYAPSVGRAHSNSREVKAFHLWKLGWSKW